MVSLQKAMEALNGNITDNVAVRAFMTNPFSLALVIVLIILVIIIFIYDAGGQRAYLRTSIYAYLIVLGIAYVSAISAERNASEKYGSKVVEQIANMPAGAFAPGDGGIRPPFTPSAPGGFAPGAIQPAALAAMSTMGAQKPATVTGQGEERPQLNIAPIINVSEFTGGGNDTGITLIDAVRH